MVDEMRTCVFHKVTLAVLILAIISQIAPPRCSCALTRLLMVEWDLQTPEQVHPVTGQALWKCSNRHPSPLNIVAHPQRLKCGDMHH
jgi:hypothetical protein